MCQCHVVHSKNIVGLKRRLKRHLYSYRLIYHKIPKHILLEVFKIKAQELYESKKKEVLSRIQAAGITRTSTKEFISDAALDIANAILVIPRIELLNTIDAKTEILELTQQDARK